jgi:hypothetical protein
VDGNAVPQESKLDKSSLRIDPPEVAIERRFKVPFAEQKGLKTAFDRIRFQLAQEAEQRSRPVSKVYNGFRAVKA